MFKLLAILLCACAVTACGVPSPDVNSASGKAQILADVDTYLNTGDCADALTAITPLYDSSNTDNTVRMAMASVYACFAGFNFFNFASKISGLSSFDNGVLFELMAEEFPSTGTVDDPLDKVVESAGFSIDSLMAVLNSGEVLIPGDLFNTSTNNEGSVLYTDRTSDSNSYLMFMSMAAIGGLENREGAQSSGKPNSTAELPWTTSSSTDMGESDGNPGPGCEYASAVMNFADSIASISSTINGQPSSTDAMAYLAYALNTVTEDAIDESFAQAITDACIMGCQDVQPTVANVGLAKNLFFDFNGGWALNTCTNGGASYNTGCSTICPLLLRDRYNCTGVDTDEISCAAAGVINFVNQSVIGWQ